ncbi:cupin, partial [Deltaproteobacteria bacterium OttesenSCG-928-K17]|nr:cupin [Deltaproteobacteria bacterium OttesenSCG-928-K17]
MENIFKIPAEIPADEACEFMETILHSDSRLYIERIISNGHTTEHGKWYDQDHDEWVVVLKGWAKVQYKNGREIHIDEGDHLFLPKRVAHRVS